ncbi:HAD-IIB family hydrolase [Povalibacter sp.]|uniref:HAD-IIB family hydrolase n=1 Tax=Povalibacter sp. TaxID=1962978 RepID=UPI002F41821F
MRYLALCADYDGTIANHGRVDGATLTALESLRASGRRLVLVTGRELDDLSRVCPRLDLFDRVVAENGALLYRPATTEERVLGQPPAATFVEALRQRGVDRVSVGRSIVATWEPHERVVLETIRDLGLELQVIFNKGAVMVLPSGVNKATGLAAALEELNLSAHNAVGVGDAENDHAFLAACECSAAVANALPSVKDKADWVLSQDHGAGVAELIQEMLASDLAPLDSVLRRHHIRLGMNDQAEEVALSPYGTSMLIVGTSGGGKSTVATGLVERLQDKGYNFCIVDPEGDYDNVEGAVVLGSPERAPSADECLKVIGTPYESAVINLLGLKFNDRPAFFMTLFARLRDLRAKTGRPHWLIVDEAHHVMPADWQPTDLALPQRLDGVVLVSVTPALIAPAALQGIGTLLVVGDKPKAMLHEFASVHELADPPVSVNKIPEGEALLWHRAAATPAQLLVLEHSRTERRRHLRKYAKGSLPEDRSFYFRGPQEKLKLRAYNLIQFMELADGVDDETWLFHLRRGEISTWLRESIKDESLADRIMAIEEDQHSDAAGSRRQVRALIEENYTLPAEDERPTR